MCYCDAEGPEVYTEKVVRSRKPHRCIECGFRMPVGTHHEVVRGLWDGRWDTFRTCLGCVELRKAVMEKSGCSCYTYGDLMEAAHEEGLLEDIEMGYDRAVYEALTRAERELAKALCPSDAEIEACIRRHCADIGVGYESDFVENLRADLKRRDALTAPWQRLL